MAGKISEHNSEELETDIVEVTDHAGARPDHAEWQGRWFSLSGKSKKYRSLREATGYGTGAGLKGWNCRHDFYPVIEGISEPTYTEEELANIDPPPIEYNGKTLTYYECTQKQRAMETAIRKTKREIIGAKASGDDDMLTAKSILLRRQKEEYANFSKAAGLLTQNERTQVYGFDKSIAQKAAWKARKAQKPLDNGGGNGIISLKGITVKTKLFDEQLMLHTITDESIENINKLSLTRLTPKDNEKLTQECKKLLGFMKNEPLGTEGAFVYDIEMNQIDTCKSKEANHRVEIKKYDKVNIVIHNHPDGLLLSEQDLTVFYDNDNTIILGAVGNNGSTFFVEKSEDYDMFGFYVFLSNTRKNHSIKMDEEEHIKFIEELMEGADEYGVKFYTRKN